VAVRLKKIVLQDLLVPAVVLFADMTGHCWPASVNCCVDAYWSRQRPEYWYVLSFYLQTVLLWPTI